MWLKNELQIQQQQNNTTYQMYHHDDKSYLSRAPPWRTVGAASRAWGGWTEHRAVFVVVLADSLLFECKCAKMERKAF